MCYSESKQEHSVLKDSAANSDMELLIQ